MATNTYTIKSSGGDYTTRSAWEAGRQGDLVSAGDIEVGECYSFVDTTALLFFGWTTDSSNYPVLKTATGEKFTDKYDDTKATLETTTTAIQIIEVDYIRIEGQQVKVTASSGTVTGIVINECVGISIDSSIIRADYSGTATGYGIQTITSGTSVTVTNSWIYDFVNGTTFCLGILMASSTITDMYNTNIIDCYYGFWRDGTVTVKNCLSYGNNDNYDTGYDSASRNNLSGPSQTDAPGSNPRNGVTVTFVDASTGNYHLSSSDTGAKDYGVGPSTDSDIPTLDIDGDTRSGTTCDIGADEISGVGPTVTVGKLVNAGLVSAGLTGGRLVKC